MPDAPDPAPPPRNPGSRWLPRPRFSLRTLVIAVLLTGSTVFLHRDWAPWCEIGCFAQQAEVGLHDDFIDPNAIAISPNGSFFTAASIVPGQPWPMDINLNVIDSNDGRIVATLGGHKGFICSAVFSQDSAKIITGGGDGTARVWDVKSGRELSVIQPEYHGYYNPHVTCAAFVSSDKALLAGYEGETFLWDLNKNAPIVKLPSKQFSRNPAAFIFANGARAMTLGDVDGSYGRKNFIWDTSTGKCIAQLEFKFYDLSHECIAGDRFVWGLLDKQYGEPFDRVEKWDLNGTEFQLVAATPLHEGVWAYALAPGGDCIVCFAATGIQRLDGVGLKDRTPIAADVRDATCLAVTPDGKRLIAGNAAGRMQVFDLTCAGKMYETSVEAIPNSVVTEIKCFPADSCRVLAIVATDHGGLQETPKAVHLLARRRPEYWWGLAWLPEFWLTALFAAALLWSVWRDRKRNHHTRPL